MSVTWLSAASPSVCLNRLSRLRHDFVNRPAVVAEDVLLNLPPDFHDAVNVRIDLQAEDGGVFRMVVVDGDIVIGRFDNGIAVFCRTSRFPA